MVSEIGSADPVFAAANRLKMIDALAAIDLGNHVIFFGLPIVWNDGADRAADHLVGGVAENPLAARFHEKTIPSRFLPTIASSLDSTIAASLSAPRLGAATAAQVAGDSTTFRRCRPRRSQRRTIVIAIGNQQTVAAPAERFDAVNRLAMCGARGQLVLFAQVARAAA